MKVFGILFIIGAIAMGIAGYRFFQPTLTEELTQKSADAAKEASRVNKSLVRLTEIASAIGGQPVPGKV